MKGCDEDDWPVDVPAWTVGMWPFVTGGGLFGSNVCYVEDLHLDPEVLDAEIKRREKRRKKQPLGFA